VLYFPAPDAQNTSMWLNGLSLGNVQLAVLSSLLLVVMYFPVSAVQSGWRDDLLSHAVTQTPELDEKQWLAVHGLSRSPWKSFIAMITPLLTAATTEIIKHFTSSL
jgi:hypothetical protein